MSSTASSTSPATWSCAAATSRPPATSPSRPSTTTRASASSNAATAARSSTSSAAPRRGRSPASGSRWCRTGWHWGCGRSVDAFDPVQKDVDEPVLSAQRADVLPDLGDPLVERSHLEIPEPDVNDPRRRSLDQDPLGEVRVLGDDRHPLLFRMAPDLSVRPLIIQVVHVDVVGTTPEAEVVGEIYVDQVPGHEGQAIILMT